MSATPMHDRMVTGPTLCRFCVGIYEEDGLEPFEGLVMTNV